MIIKNTATGESFPVDRRRSRVRRMQKRVHSWAQFIQPGLQKRSARYREVMITLTYKDADAWRPNQIRDFMTLCRFCLGADLLAYAWVAEMQQREAVHYHVILVVNRGTFIPKPDEYGWWEYGSTKIETARSLYYIVTYTGKEYQKMAKFPKGLRMFSTWISKNLVQPAAFFFHHLTALPAWLAAEVQQLGCSSEEWSERARRKNGGGWLFMGECFKSPFICFMGY